MLHFFLKIHKHRKGQKQTPRVTCKILLCLFLGKKEKILKFVGKKYLRSHRDLNSDRWIQSPKC
jgi:hypothetical protein